MLINSKCVCFDKKEVVMKKKGIKKALIALVIVLFMSIAGVCLIRIHLINESNKFVINDFNKSINNIFGIIRCKKICDYYGIEAEIDEVFDLKENYEKFIKQVDLDGCDTRDLAKVVYINNYLEVENEEKYIKMLKEECYNKHIGIYDTWAFKKHEEENLAQVEKIDVNKVVDTIYIYKIFYGTELEEEILTELQIYDGLVKIYEETEDLEIKAKIYGSMFDFGIYRDIDCREIKDEYIREYKDFEKDLINENYVYSMAYYLTRNTWKKYEQLGIDCTVFKEAAKKWTFEDVNKLEWAYGGDTKNENMLLLSGLYIDEVGIEDSIFIIEEFAESYGQIVTDYSDKYLVDEFNSLCEEFLDKQILFGI